MRMHQTHQMRKDKRDMMADMTALEQYLGEMFRRKLSGMAIAIRGPKGLIFERDSDSETKNARLCLMKIQYSVSLQ